MDCDRLGVCRSVSSSLSRPTDSPRNRWGWRVKPTKLLDKKSARRQRHHPCLARGLLTPPVKVTLCDGPSAVRTKTSQTRVTERITRWVMTLEVLLRVGEMNVRDAANASTVSPRNRFRIAIKSWSRSR